MKTFILIMFIIWKYLNVLNATTCSPNWKLFVVAISGFMFFHWSGNSKTFNGKLTKYFRIGFNIQILRRKGLTIAKPSEYGMTTIIVHFKILVEI